ncbi:hypothetical protein [Halomonas sp. I5-271120]|uniref:hypothetical protein n=1 Tax=Halomonas sp. I5-271120 TaxID=3061632 RepID=UPI0027152077|nr:hypothetical protein [Halomonas sp. I5-271120]
MSYRKVVLIAVLAGMAYAGSAQAQSGEGNGSQSGFVLEGNNVANAFRHQDRQQPTSSWDEQQNSMKQEGGSGWESNRKAFDGKSQNAMETRKNAFEDRGGSSFDNPNNYFD